MSRSISCSLRRERSISSISWEKFSIVDVVLTRSSL
jgi:hypothetical protein